MNDNTRNTEKLKGEKSKLQAFHFSDTLLPSEFTLTAEEQLLLDTYDSIRRFEKESAKLRELQAKQKLAEADLRYKLEKEKKENQPSEEKESLEMVTQQNTQRKSAKKRKDRSTTSVQPATSESAVQSAEESSEDEEETFIKLSEVKSEAHQKSALESVVATEEAMRGELLGEAARADLVPLIKKKPKKEGPDLSMLLSAVEPLSTPPHDFSKSLGLVSDGVEGARLSMETSSIQTPYFIFFLFFKPRLSVLLLKLQALFSSLHLHLAWLIPCNLLLRLGLHQQMHSTQLIVASKSAYQILTAANCQAVIQLKLTILLL